VSGSSSRKIISEWPGRFTARYYCNATTTCREHNQNRWRPSKITIGILSRSPILYG
jgi:hypothetical protein